MWVIGIAGVKGSGKDTAANFLRDLFAAEVLPKTVAIHAYAQPLKRVCQELFLLTEEQLYNQEAKEQVDDRWGLSPRAMLQQVGTDYVRAQWGSDFWLKHMRYYLDAQQQQGTDVVIIPDVRFQNEVDFIHEYGTTNVVLYIDRTPPQPQPLPQPLPKDGHISELGVHSLQNIDIRLLNHSTLPKFYRMLFSWYSSQFDNNTK